MKDRPDLMQCHHIRETRFRKERLMKEKCEIGVQLFPQMHPKEESLITCAVASHQG